VEISAQNLMKRNQFNIRQTFKKFITVRQLQHILF